MGTSSQRQEYRKYLSCKGESFMTPQRISDLDAVEFDWDPYETSWNLRFTQLRQFKSMNGHCNVPRTYKPDRALARWVVRQRENRRWLKQGKSSGLTAARERMLNGIGFVWDVVAPGDKRRVRKKVGPPPEVVAPHRPSMTKRIIVDAADYGYGSGDDDYYARLGASPKKARVEEPPPSPTTEEGCLLPQRKITHVPHFPRQVSTEAQEQEDPTTAATAAAAPAMPVGPLSIPTPQTMMPGRPLALPTNDGGTPSPFAGGGQQQQTIPEGLLALPVHENAPCSLEMPPPSLTPAAAPT
eukprot:CAMPEP_0113564958 /NCGR_PEP_ID=MMETSP0015_2-20120614/21911_1 /TAXON_ID=2838 /ORGANISM="Odontella" /LENGTH=297 /DNA_ID=CAMNT_0000467103 /DNA_START=243 /DNA_END=1133 /DNA_ORIENTATION=+ /assembly_acc=CAM_ASM_000160